MTTLWSSLKTFIFLGIFASHFVNASFQLFAKVETDGSQDASSGKFTQINNTDYFKDLSAISSNERISLLLLRDTGPSLSSGQVKNLKLEFIQIQNEFEEEGEIEISQMFLDSRYDSVDVILTIPNPESSNSKVMTCSILKEGKEEGTRIKSEKSISVTLERPQIDSSLVTIWQHLINESVPTNIGKSSLDTFIIHGLCSKIDVTTWFSNGEFQDLIKGKHIKLIEDISNNSNNSNERDSMIVKEIRNIFLPNHSITKNHQELIQGYSLKTTQSKDGIRRELGIYFTSKMDNENLKEMVDLWNKSFESHSQSLTPNPSPSPSNPIPSKEKKGKKLQSQSQSINNFSIQAFIGDQSGIDLIAQTLKESGKRKWSIYLASQQPGYNPETIEEAQKRLKTEPKKEKIKESKPPIPAESPEQIKQRKENERLAKLEKEKAEKAKRDAEKEKEKLERQRKVKEREENQKLARLEKEAAKRKKEEERLEKEAKAKKDAEDARLRQEELDRQYAEKRRAKKEEENAKIRQKKFKNEGSLLNKKQEPEKQIDSFPKEQEKSEEKGNKLSKPSNRKKKLERLEKEKQERLKQEESIREKSNLNSGSSSSLFISSIENVTSSMDKLEISKSKSGESPSIIDSNSNSMKKKDSTVKNVSNIGKSIQSLPPPTNLFKSNFAKRVPIGSSLTKERTTQSTPKRKYETNSNQENQEPAPTKISSNKSKPAKNQDQTKNQVRILKKGESMQDKSIQINTQKEIEIQNARKALESSSKWIVAPPTPTPTLTPSVTDDLDSSLISPISPNQRSIVTDQSVEKGNKRMRIPFDIATDSQSHSSSKSASISHMVTDSNKSSLPSNLKEEMSESISFAQKHPEIPITHSLTCYESNKDNILNVYCPWISKETGIEISSDGGDSNSDDMNFSINKEIEMFSKWAQPTELELNRNEIFDQVSSLLENIFSFKKYQNLYLRDVLKVKFETCQLYGSTAMGLPLRGSDVDISLNLAGEFNLNDQGTKRQLLKVIHDEIKNGKLFHGNHEIKIIETNNLVSFTFIGTDIKVDITLNKPQVIECAKNVNKTILILNSYKPIILVVKQFLRTWKFNEPYSGGIGGYGTATLVIYYLRMNGIMGMESGSESRKEINFESLINGFFKFMYEFDCENNVLFFENEWKNPKILSRSQYISEKIEKNPRFLKKTLAERGGIIKHIQTSQLVLMDPYDEFNVITRSAFKFNIQGEYNLRNLFGKAAVALENASNQIHINEKYSSRDYPKRKISFLGYIFTNHSGDKNLNQRNQKRIVSLPQNTEERMVQNSNSYMNYKNGQYVQYNRYNQRGQHWRSSSSQNAFPNIRRRTGQDILGSIGEGFVPVYNPDDFGMGIEDSEYYFHGSEMNVSDVTDFTNQQGGSKWQLKWEPKPDGSGNIKPFDQSYLYPSSISSSLSSVSPSSPSDMNQNRSLSFSSVETPVYQGKWTSLAIKQALKEPLLIPGTPSKRLEDDDLSIYESKNQNGNLNHFFS